MTDVSKEEHAETVASLTLKFFKKILNVFPDLKKYDNNDDLLLLKYGAYLHDIGVIFEKKLGRGHHKIGRDLILENKISGLDETSNLIVANIVRYHRKSLPNILKHETYALLGEADRKKTDVFASIVRLMDAVDYNHFNMVDDMEILYEETENILTLTLGVNIMLNVGYVEVLDKKKKFFEKVFKTEVLFN
ncbi:MAG: HD domain-containing protein [Candidatus Gastranaerophilales bacterium]|nr:HD domain-containing protein [Candidatus Gastranaerophilales bacterium]